MTIPNSARSHPIDLPSVLAEFDASGQSVAAFARSRGLAPWRLYHALKRRRSSSRLAQSRSVSARPPLLPVRVVPDTVAARRDSSLELELAGGHRLRIGTDFDADLLRRVLGALAQC